MAFIFNPKRGAYRYHRLACSVPCPTFMARFVLRFMRGWDYGSYNDAAGGLS
jgi:hypothetical protein